MGAASAPPTGPATWSNRRLAAQLVMAGIDMGRLGMAQSWARSGLGGVFLLGRPPTRLGPRLRRIVAAGRPAPFVASDEEGGSVQRLAARIHPLPSAEWMGSHRTPRQVRRIALHYGRRMRALHVTVDLAAVADLAVPGRYIAGLGRAFSANPRRVAAYVKAWQAGMRAAGVAPTVKHWPGHGAARNTHTGAATTPRLSRLERRDMVPFRAAFGAGVPIVMVGHLTVPGLTEPGRPASLSPRALRYLRQQAGPRTLVVTDSLSMGAVTSALRLTGPRAAVRSLQAGADMVLVDGRPPMRVARAIRRAIHAGDLLRGRAVASVRRILAVKRSTRR